MATLREAALRAASDDPDAEEACLILLNCMASMATSLMNFCATKAINFFLIIKKSVQIILILMGTDSLTSEDRHILHHS